MHFRKYSGDNRDQGKGFVFHHLADQLRNFRIDPMVTDENLPAGPQRQAFIEAYRRFLRLADGHQIVNGDINYLGGTPVVRTGKTESYFHPHINTEYDIFLDPDTGIGERGREFVPYRVISDLLPAASERVLAVYVSSNRNDVTWRWLLDQVAGWADGRLQAFVCDLGGEWHSLPGEQGK
jgi:hypothetical protein